MATNNTMYKPITCPYDSNCADKGIKCLGCANYPRETHYTPYYPYYPTYPAYPYYPYHHWNEIWC